MLNQTQWNKAGPDLEKVIRLHREGLRGSVTAVQEAHRLLERLRIEHPGDPLADAYHGNIMILIARDKTKPLEKLNWSKSGLKLLDAAATAAPKDGMIRLLRGKSTYMLPEKYFRRADTAIEDYTFLIEREKRGEGFLEKEEYWQLVYELGEAYRRVGRNADAAETWGKLAKETTDPDFLGLLKFRMQSLEGKPPVESIPPPRTGTSIMLEVAARATGSAFQSFGGQLEQREFDRKKRKKKRRR